MKEQMSTSETPEFIYRTQVNKFGEWVNIGKPHRTKEQAHDWLSVVKSAWHGTPTRVKKVRYEQARKILAGEVKP